MSTDDDDRPALAGESVSDAVATVVENRDVDETTARYALQHVVDDQMVVTREGATASLGETAKVLSTPETRIEVTTDALEDARAAAEGLEDLDTVAAKLAGFEARLSEVRSGVETLAADLQTLVDEELDEGDLFAIGREIGRIRSTAGDYQGAADELKLAINEFEAWLAEPATRREELAADLDALADAIGDREAALDAIAAAADGAEQDGEVANPAETWAQAAVGHRVADLLLADLRTELADVRTIADRRETARSVEEAPALDELERRLEALTQRREAVGDRLAAVARPAWREQFSGRLGAVEDVLADREPPVAWGDLQAALEDAGA